MMTAHKKLTKAKVAFAGQLVRERIWHPSQKIQETSDGGLELTLQLSALHEIEPLGAVVG